MKHRYLLFMSVTGLVLTMAQLVEAGIYKWVDENGQVHYGEKPAGNKAQEVIIKPHGGTGSGPTTPPVDQRDNRDKMLRAMEDDRHAREEEKQKRKKAEHENKMRCARARDNLKRYNAAGSLYKLDSEGNRITLSDAQRRKATEKLQMDIKKWCG